MNLNANSILTLDGVDELVRKRARDAQRPYDELAEAILDGTLTDPLQVMAEVERLNWKPSELRSRCESIAAKRIADSRPKPPAAEVDSKTAAALVLAGEILDGRHPKPDRISEQEHFTSLTSNARTTTGRLSDALGVVKKTRFDALALSAADGANLPADIDALLARLDRTREDLDLAIRRIRQTRAIENAG